MPAILAPLAQIAISLGQFTLLVLEGCRTLITSPPQWKLIRDQLFSIGVLSLPVVAITGFSTGLVLAAQSFFQLSDKGLEGTTGILVAKAMITELGPVLTAFMVTGRVGAAMCAEIGTMRVTEQIDALQSMAVSPVRYLVAPRLLAGVSMMPLLTVFSAAMGMLGGYLMAVFFFNMPPIDYLSPIPIHLNNFDVVSGFAKSLLFGLLISTISCYKGMTTKGGAAGVGKATTNSVVICYSCILISNFLLTVALNMVRIRFMGG